MPGLSGNQLVLFSLESFLMFPEKKSRETSELEGKQNQLFPSGPDIKCMLLGGWGHFKAGLGQ